MRLVIDDCSIEIIPKVKGMSIVSYEYSILDYDGFIEEAGDISGPREFSNLLGVLSELVQKAIANLDSKDYRC